MYRILGIVVAGAALSVAGAAFGEAGWRGFTSPDARDNESAYAPVTVDIASLLTAARGAPPEVCWLAAQAVRNFGWGNWSDAPSTPLSDLVSDRNLTFDRDDLAETDVQLLLQSIESDDACVSELSVRMLTGQKRASVATGLIERLRNNSPAVRRVAAFGLGLVEPPLAVEPLIRALRDGSVDVRANSAWALGRLEDGRALAHLLDLFRDDSEKVRAAAVVGVGRMDSTSAVSALMQVVRQDNAPSVRRVAAWALGQLESEEAVEVLSGVLRQDADPRVREMVAWALGNIENRGSEAALAMALRRDTDDRVRETSAWALAQIEDRSSLEVLGVAAGSDRSARVRGTAAWAIGQLDGDGLRAPAGLLQVLKDANDDARLKAAWALGNLGDAGALPALREALRVEQSAQVRRALIRALMKSGETSQAAMTELLTSSDPQVREAAVRGLAGRSSFNPWPWPQPRPRPFP